MFVLARMVLNLLEQHVRLMVPTSVILALTNFTKLAKLALDVDLLAVLEQEKRLLVLQRLIVFVLKTIALVTTALSLQEQLVLHMIQISARRVMMVTILVVRCVLPMVAPVATGI